MEEKSYVIEGRQVILHVTDRICTSVRDLIQSTVFVDTVHAYWTELSRRDSSLQAPLLATGDEAAAKDRAVDLLRVLSGIGLDQAADILPWAKHLTQPHHRRTLHEFVEGLYNFWRSFDRFMVLHSEPGPSSFDQRPYRSFNATAENINHIVRALYRDVCENITNDRPRIYRQVSAGCDVALIAVPRKTPLPAYCNDLLAPVPFIRQVMMEPPLIIDPPRNTRTGQFQRVPDNPLERMTLDPNQWLCFPAKVGPLTIFVYFHQMFMGLGCALANLFELADDDDLLQEPDAIYLFGAPPEAMARYGELPTVFYDDSESGLLIAAVPAEERFGYFGYLKKMILTLHNIAMMKQGRMPFHGAMVRVTLEGDKSATFLIIGDTATGKSESLEALRLAGNDRIKEIRIVADDMGSLHVDSAGTLRGYGSETGAFVRLDDLAQGYAFEQIDRAIFMSPHKTNGRVVLPVTTMHHVLHGYPIDYLLYANNYEQVDDERPVLEPFTDPEKALDVFRQGAAMAKGTTSATGLVHSYFANIFGAPQYRDLHESLAQDIFTAAFNSGLFVGQLRTRLATPGFESEGPRQAAQTLLQLIESAPTTGKPL